MASRCHRPISLNPKSLEIRLRSAFLVNPLRSGEEIGACEPARPYEPGLALSIAARLKRTGSIVAQLKRAGSIVAQLKRAGMEKKLLIGHENERSGTKADASLLKLSARAILHGRQPAELTANKLMADTRAPIHRDEQQVRFGFD